MRLKCEQCGIEGYLQQIGRGYFRVRHYKGINKETNKSEFFYHQQTKEYIDRILPNIEHLNTPIELKLKDNSSFSVNIAGGVGFEPTITDLGGRCSIRPELPAHLLSSCSSSN